MVKKLKFRFAKWYMGRVAGRYCPCEWPIRSKKLIHLCGRIDDLNDRREFHRFCGFILSGQNMTSSTGSNFTVTWKNGPS